MFLLYQRHIFQALSQRVLWRQEGYNENERKREEKEWGLNVCLSLLGSSNIWHCLSPGSDRKPKADTRAQCQPEVC